MAGEEHSEGVGGEKSEIQLTKAVGPGGAVEWDPPGECALDDARRFPGGMEGSVGGEGQEKRENLRLHLIRIDLLCVYMYVYGCN